MTPKTSSEERVARQPEIVITRSKIYPQPSRPGAAWNWVYKVSSPGDYPASGTAGEVRHIAKIRAARTGLPIVEAL